MIKDPDFFWHLKIGQLILEKASLIRTNTLSGLFPDQSWDNPEWLFQVILAGVSSIGGWTGIATLKAMLASSLVLLSYATARGAGAGRPAAAALSLLLVSAARFRLTERPHLFSHLFLALVVFLVERFRRESRRSYYVAIPVIFAVWSNVHPGVIFGLAYLAVVSAADLVLGRSPWSGASVRGWGLLGITGLSVAAALLNPLGYRVLTYGWEQGEFHGVLGITEFTNATPVAHPTFYLLAVLVALAVAVARRTDIPLLAATVVFFSLSVAYRRSIPDFALLGTLVVAKTLGSRALIPWSRVTASALLLVGAISIIWCVRWDRNYTYRFGSGPLESALPVEAADFLERESVPGNLYNEYPMGGYLAFRLFPRYRIFQDGRIPAYPRDFFITPHQRGSGLSWPERLVKYNINSAVVEIPLLNSLFQGDEWALLHWDDRFAVIVRRSRVDRGLLERLEYRQYRPYLPLSAALPAEALQRVENEMLRNQRARRHPSWLIPLDLAHLKSLTGRKQEAADLLGHAEQLVPNDRTSLERLAQEWLLAGRTDRSAAAYGRARQLMPVP